MRLTLIHLKHVSVNYYSLHQARVALNCTGGSIGYFSACTFWVVFTQFIFLLQAEACNYFVSPQTSPPLWAFCLGNYGINPHALEALAVGKVAPVRTTMDLEKRNGSSTSGFNGHEKGTTQSSSTSSAIHAHLRYLVFLLVYLLTFSETIYCIYLKIQIMLNWS